MMPPRRLLICLITFLVAFSLPVKSATNNKAQAEKELKILKAAISDIQQELQANLKEQSEAQQKIQTIDKALAQATTELRQTRDKLRTAQQKLDQLKVEQQQKITLREKQRKQLAAQLKSAYISGKQEYVKLILNQEDPTKVSRMLEYFRYLNQARIDDIEELQETLEQLKTIEQEIQTTLY